MTKENRPANSIDRNGNLMTNPENKSGDKGIVPLKIKCCNLENSPDLEPKFSRVPIRMNISIEPLFSIFFLDVKHGKIVLKMQRLSSPKLRASDLKNKFRVQFWKFI